MALPDDVKALIHSQDRRLGFREFEAGEMNTVATASRITSIVLIAAEHERPLQAFEEIRTTLGPEVNQGDDGIGRER